MKRILVIHLPASRMLISVLSLAIFLNQRNDTIYFCPEDEIIQGQIGPVLDGQEGFRVCSFAEALEATANQSNYTLEVIGWGHRLWVESGKEIVAKFCRHSPVTVSFFPDGFDNRVHLYPEIDSIVEENRQAGAVEGVIYQFFSYCDSVVRLWGKERIVIIPVDYTLKSIKLLSQDKDFASALATQIRSIENCGSKNIVFLIMRSWCQPGFHEGRYFFGDEASTLADLTHKVLTEIIEDIGEEALIYVRYDDRYFDIQHSAVAKLKEKGDYSILEGQYYYEKSFLTFDLYFAAMMDVLGDGYRYYLYAYDSSTPYISMALNQSLKAYCGCRVQHLMDAGATPENVRYIQSFTQRAIDLVGDLHQQILYSDYEYKLEESDSFYKIELVSKHER